MCQHYTNAAYLKMKQGYIAVQFVLRNKEFSRLKVDQLEKAACLD